MPDRPRNRPDGGAAQPLWFLRDPDALVRRLVVRTLLEPPPGMRMRRLRPRWLKR